MLEGLFASALSYAMAILTIFAVNVKIFDDDGDNGTALPLCFHYKYIQYI